MADYVVTLTGKDNLSKTIQSVKKELDGVGGSAQKLDKVSAQFDKISKSTMPLNKRVKETSKLLSQMNFDGDFNAAQFLKMAKEAGKAKDAISDTQQVIKAFADDNFALNAVVQGVQGIAAAGSVATGAMALFGVESETAAEAIRKVQGALAILNGLQTVANVLNKDSYVSIARKIIGLKLEAAATDKATAAQTRLNIAVLANPYVAAAAAIAALVAGIYALTRSTNDATNAQEEFNEKQKESTTIERKANESASEQIAKLKVLYTITQDNTKSLKERNAAATEMKRMYPDILSGLNNEAILAGKAADAYNDIADAILRMAMAEAAYDKIKKLTKELLDLEEADREFNESLNNLSNQRRDAASQQGINLPAGSANYRNPERDKIEKTISRLVETYGSGIVNSLVKGIGNGVGGRFRGGTVGGGSNKGGIDDVSKGLIGNLENDIERLKKEAKEATTETDIQSKLKELEQKEKELFNLKVRVGLEVDPELKNQEETKKKLEEALQENFNKGVELEVAYDARPSVNANYGQSSFDKAVGNGIDRNSLDGIQTMMDYNDTLIEQLRSLASSYEQLGLTGGDAYKGIIEMLKKLKQEQGELGEQADGIVKTNEQAEKTSDNFNDAMNALNSFGSAMSTLGQVAEDEGVQVAGIVAQAIAQIALGYASATAQAGKLGPWGWVAFAAAGLAQMMAMISQIKSVTGGYASGGIIGGTSYSGDKLLARVNSGEMVLNKRQQSNLFNAINSGNIGGGTVSTVQFKLRGADIYGSMKTYQAIKSKTGLKGI